MIKATANAKQTGLVGRGFVIWAEVPDYQGPVPQFTGRVAADLGDGNYLVQYYDALIGAPSTFHIFHISTMTASTGGRVDGGFEFFADADHLSEWIESVGNHTWTRKKKTEAAE